MSMEENKSDDKINKSTFASGVLFWAYLAGLFTCACMRGCQEIKKHIGKNADKAKVTYVENVR